MIQYSIDTTSRKRWKDYPVRVRGVRVSACHSQPTWIVRSKEGGFITENCSECGKHTTLSRKGFYDLDICVACPQCANVMSKIMLPKDKKAANYSFACEPCGIFIRFADVLPDWKDIGWSGDSGVAR